MEKKEQTRLRVQRYRDKQKSVTYTPNIVTQDPNSVTQMDNNVTLDVTLTKEEYARTGEALMEGIRKSSSMRRDELYNWAMNYKEPAEPREDDGNPAIVHALADLPKRAKLRRICEGLNRRGLGHLVRYGVNGPTMLEVSELLEAF